MKDIREDLVIYTMSSSTTTSLRGRRSLTWQSTIRWEEINGCNHHCSYDMALERHATLAMTFIVDCVTARRLTTDVAVHQPVRQYKRPQPPMFVSLEHWITKLRSR